MQYAASVTMSFVKTATVTQEVATFLPTFRHALPTTGHLHTSPARNSTNAATDSCSRVRNANINQGLAMSLISAWFKMIIPAHLPAAQAASATPAPLTSI